MVRADRWQKRELHQHVVVFERGADQPNKRRDDDAHRQRQQQVPQIAAGHGRSPPAPQPQQRVPAE